MEVLRTIFVFGDVKGAARKGETLLDSRDRVMKHFPSQAFKVPENRFLEC